MLTEFGPGIWICQGTEVRAAFGFHYPTRMVVVRLDCGELFIWSPVAITSNIQTTLKQLGTVAHVVAPNPLHDSFLSQWRTSYPEAQFHAPPRLIRTRADIKFASELGDGPYPAWQGEIDQVVVRGNVITTEVVFFHHQSSTVLFTDLLQHFPKGWFGGWRNVIARLDLMTGPEPAVPRKFRVAFRDKTVAREAIRQILNWPVQKVVMAHGSPIETDGSTFLRGAFRWLDVGSV